MHRFLSVAVIISVLCLATGCGQKGPLILPEDDAPAKAKSANSGEERAKS